jgi:Transcriptional Coactivator p15 (PC4).
MSELYNRVIYENEVKGEQYRLTVSEFREQMYLHIRKYYLSFDEGYLPTKEGACIPMTIGSVAELFDALVDLLSETEVKFSFAKELRKELEEIVNDGHLDKVERG